MFVKIKGRGMLSNVSEDNKKKWCDFVGVKEMTSLHLIFLPYLMECALNNIPLDRAELWSEEKEITEKITKRKLCECFPWNTPVNFHNKEFYDLVCDILYDGYINLYGEEDE